MNKKLGLPFFVLVFLHVMFHFFAFLPLHLPWPNDVGGGREECMSLQIMHAQEKNVFRLLFESDNPF